MQGKRPTRMLVMFGLAAAYMAVLAIWGSPLLAFTSWMGWVPPQTGQ